MKAFKRYIASAVCPACGLMDKIYLQKKEDDECIECISCGYQERKSDLLKPKAEHAVTWHLPKKSSKNEAV